MTMLILQGPGLNDDRAREMASHTASRVTHRRGYYRLEGADEIPAHELQALRAAAPFDINILPQGFDPLGVKLALFDMDSTFIAIECIDEIADMLNLKPEVAKITESAMRGEIDFAASLRRRVQLLAGLEATRLEEVYAERVRLNPGAETLLAGLRGRGIRVALVSGGFTFFSERLKTRYALDFARANTLEIENGRLSGRVLGDIVDAQGKADFLGELCAELGISAKQAVVVGDGANDLKMLARAGLGVAYHAKAIVQQSADAVIDRCGLEGVLGLLEIEPIEAG